MKQTKKAKTVPSVRQTKVARRNKARAKPELSVARTKSLPGFGAEPHSSQTNWFKRHRAAKATRKNKMDTALESARIQAREVGKNIGAELAELIIAAQPSPTEISDVFQKTMDCIQLQNIMPTIPGDYLELLKSEIALAATNEMIRQVENIPEPEHDEESETNDK